VPTIPALSIRLPVPWRRQDSPLIDWKTNQEITPHGGSVLFKMRGFAIALAPLPKTFDIVKIKAALVEWGDSLNCDVSMDDTVDESYHGSFYAG
jgi:hypothetical protein